MASTGSPDRGALLLFLFLLLSLSSEIPADKLKSPRDIQETDHYFHKDREILRATGWSRGWTGKYVQMSVSSHTGHPFL